MDQSAERILFAVGESSTTMAVQIQFRGDASDFAWVLPLVSVPPPDSLALFPQRAFTALDANTGPTFLMPDDPACNTGLGCPVCFGAPAAAPGAESAPAVTIHYEVEVGPYEAAVVESSDPQALVTWLREHGYRVPVVMEPYISVYTTEGLKFLALKLLPGQGESDIQPLQFTLPGQTPSIPIRLTALAAEPEMGLLVFILGDQRYEGANWESVVIDDASIRWGIDYSTFGFRTNWATLVAKGIDAAGGHGWVTELATPTTPYADQVRNQLQGGFFPQPEDATAATTLLGLLETHPYLTRLYARVSAEEMTLDPIFRRSDGGDVDGAHQLERYVDGKDLCPDTLPEPEPCDFTTCGAGGECYAVGGNDAGTTTPQPGCACVPGATARTTLDPSGTATVICQDLRMSFLNPGDNSDGTALPDPCAGFDCGLGHCESVNLTPTCVCDEGAVAIGSFASDGMRQTTCVAPSIEVPSAFYMRRLPPLSAALPGGRDIAVDGTDGGSLENAAGGSTVSGGGWCSITAVSRPAPSSAPWAALASLVSLSAVRRGRAGSRRRSP